MTANTVPAYWTDRGASEAAASWVARMQLLYRITRLQAQQSQGVPPYEAALDRAFEVTWPRPDWDVIIPALAEAEQHLREAGLMTMPELMTFTHLARRAASQHRGDDTRDYIGNIRSYLPTRGSEPAGTRQRTRI